MKFDKKEHQELIARILAGSTFPGNMVLLAAEVIAAVNNAEVPGERVYEPEDVEGQYKKKYSSPDPTAEDVARAAERNKPGIFERVFGADKPA
jgi:hypothetical protein